MNDLDTFTENSEVEYQRLLNTYSDEPSAILTINIFTIKKVKENNPIRAKSRIMVLGNHEKIIWTRKDRYTPVLSASFARLLTSMVVEEGRYLK